MVLHDAKDQFYTELYQKVESYDIMFELFELLKASLFNGDPIQLTDWQATFDEMKEQSVAALPGEWLKMHCPSAKSWLSFCFLQQGQWVKIMYAQRQLIQLLEAKDILSVIIKGAAATVYYPHPTLRTMGDVDVLVKRDVFERVAALLEESGYKLTKEKDHCEHHYNYSKDGISIELHKRLLIVRDEDEKLLALFENGIDHREWKTVEGHRFPALPTALNGLVLIFHINQHLRNGLGLRQIIDWMMYVNSLSDGEWEQFLPLLKETGMEKLALSVTAMCQKHLGLQKTIPGCESIDPEICDDLMAYIMEKGNFGRKVNNTVDGRMASFSLSSTEHGGFFRRLQDGGLCQWDAARKHRLLRPFAWIYQIFHILGVLIRNRVSPKQILAQRNKGREQRKLIEALGLRMDLTIQFDG